VVASAAESEVGACFQNAQSGAPLRVTLAELGHIQPPTPLRTDNSTAFGILNETINQTKIKSNGHEIPLVSKQGPPKNNLTFIGAQDVKISVIITQNIIQHDITKICAD
jgi:hypothetical protein